MLVLVYILIGLSPTSFRAVGSELSVFPPMSLVGDAKGLKAQDSEAETPLDIDQITGLLSVLPDRALAGQISKRGINFRVTHEVIRIMKDKGAGARTLAALELFLSNRQPSVTVRVEKATVAKGEFVRLVAEATDPDSDPLRFQWATTGGLLSGDGAVVTLDTISVPVMARPAQVTISVTVGDRKGGFASASKSVSVRHPNSHVGEALSVSTSTEGKYIVVTLTGALNEPDGVQGAIEVVLSQSSVGANSYTGNLPGVPCRADFIGLENVAEYSFKEPPGISNGWSKAILRLKPKNRSRDIKFSLGWQILGEASPR